MQKRLFFFMFLSSLMGASLAFGGYFLLIPKSPYQNIEQRQQESLKWLIDSSATVPKGLNFLYASKKVSPAVVHIKTTTIKRRANYGEDAEIEDMIRQFHGGGMPSYPRQSSGSGVILTDDGYIITNYHVISEAGQVEVILNDKRSYIAQLIGKDPSTDLALLKIEAKNLAFVPYGNSENLQIGEWVLAIGNPFDLTSTVTAGIVSAKGRNINLLKDQYAIESFIQTDAAVNPGNSGGALVNLKGELIGINTAIATQTGYYAGYSFAVPINIVKKVTQDLMQHGEIQRAILGVSIREIDATLAQELDLQDLDGVYISGVIKNSAASDAGIKVGDVIKKIEGVAINSAAELQTRIAMHRPGDKVSITFARKKALKKTNVILKNQQGEIKLLGQAPSQEDTVLGAKFREADYLEKQKLGIEYGVKIVWLGNGKLKKYGVKEGFIITHINNQHIKNPKELIKIANQHHSPITLDGVYPNGRRDYYAIDG